MGVSILFVPEIVATCVLAKRRADGAPISIARVVETFGPVTVGDILRSRVVHGGMMVGFEERFEVGIVGVVP